MCLDVLRVARTDLEAVIVLKVNVEVVNVLALLQTENATLMFVGIVGSGELFSTRLRFVVCYTLPKHSRFLFSSELPSTEPLNFCSCGDGSLGVPSQRGDNYECRNMKLLLKQQQRVITYNGSFSFSFFPINM